MAKNSVSDWDTTAANNTDIDGHNIDENCSPAGINNAIRAMMAQIATLDPLGKGENASLTGTLDFSGATLTMPTALEVLNGSSITGLTGSDVNIVTGTAGTTGNLSEWNEDDDLVDGPAYGTGANELLQLDGDGKVPASATPLTKEYQSTGQTMVAAGLLTLAHSLGAQPKIIRLYAECTTAEEGYSIGDKFDITATIARGTAGADNRGFAVTFDATNVLIRNGNSSVFANTVNASTGNAAPLSRANWDLYVEAWA